MGERKRRVIEGVEVVSGCGLSCGWEEGWERDETREKATPRSAVLGVTPSPPPFARSMDPGRGKRDQTVHDREHTGRFPRPTRRFAAPSIASHRPPRRDHLEINPHDTQRTWRTREDRMSLCPQPMRGDINLCPKSGPVLCAPAGAGSRSPGPVNPIANHAGSVGTGLT